MSSDFSSPPPYPVLQILSSHLLHNLKTIRNHCKNTSILIPVKANAYGCGLEEIMPFFIEHEIEAIGVANPQEGVLARSYGFKGMILNLGGFYRENANLFFEHNITPSITDFWQIQVLKHCAQEFNTILPVHLKWDLGMGRIGLKKEQYSSVVTALREPSNLKVTGLFTHFPCADSDDAALTFSQLNVFQELALSFLSDLSLPREQVTLHCANSYAMMRFSETHLDMVRPGILFYGYYQSENDRLRYRDSFCVKPALRLIAKAISLRQLAKGDTVSYGSLYTCTKEIEEVGVIPLGYADGIPRALTNTSVHFSGHPLLGRVTMDQIILGGVICDEPLEILGGDCTSVERWGDLSSSFSYEIITGLGQRLRRELV